MSQAYEKFWTTLNTDQGQSQIARESFMLSEAMKNSSEANRIKELSDADFAIFLTAVKTSRTLMMRLSRAEDQLNIRSRRDLTKKNVGPHVTISSAMGQLSPAYLGILEPLARRLWGNDLSVKDPLGYLDILKAIESRFKPLSTEFLKDKKILVGAIRRRMNWAMTHDEQEDAMAKLISATNQLSGWPSASAQFEISQDANHLLTESDFIPEMPNLPRSVLFQHSSSFTEAIDNSKQRVRADFNQFVDAKIMLSAL